MRPPVWTPFWPRLGGRSVRRGAVRVPERGRVRASASPRTWSGRVPAGRAGPRARGNDRGETPAKKTGVRLFERPKPAGRFFPTLHARRPRQCRKVKTSRVRVALARGARDATARWVDTRVLPFSESEESRRLRAARLRDPTGGDLTPGATAFRGCDSRLDKTRASRDDRGHHRGGFAVTDERFRDKAKHADAVNAAEELITLAVVALSSPAAFAARLRRASRGADAAARIGAAIAGGDRYCASFAWRAVAVFEEALGRKCPRCAPPRRRSPKDPTGRNDFAGVRRRCCSATRRRRRRPPSSTCGGGGRRARRAWYRAANAARNGPDAREKLAPRGAARTSRPGRRRRAPGRGAARDGRRPNRNRRARGPQRR